MIHTITLTSNLPDGWSFYEKLKDNGALAAGANGDILQPGRHRREALRHDRRLHADPREGQGRAGRIRLPEARASRPSASRSRS